MGQQTTETLTTADLPLLSSVLTDTRLQIDTVGHGPKINGTASYLMPGPTLQQLGEAMGQPLEMTALDVPGLSAAGCNVAINNVHVVLSDQTLRMNLQNGLGIWMALDSINPTLVLFRSAWWSVCPNIQLSYMTVSLQLLNVRARPDAKGITYEDVSADFDFAMDIYGLPNFSGIRDAIRDKLKGSIRDMLLSEGSKQTVSTAVLEVFDQKKKLTNPKWKGIANVTRAEIKNETLTLELGEKAE